MSVFTSKKKLGFGLMRLPLLDENDKGSIDIEHTKKMVDAFIENGFTYFDTAWMYCSFKSECATKEALVSRYPRESFTLASKFHCAFVKDKKERDEFFEEQFRKTGVEYFDYYLIHDVNKEHYVKYNELDAFNWIQEKKAEGRVKCVGFSFHDTAEFLDQVLTEHPEMEFVQLQINYLDWESEKVQSRKCYEVAVKHGKEVIVMEPVKGGTLAKIPESVEKMFKAYDKEASAASWAIRFSASLPNVKIVLSGMSNMEQIEDNMSYMKEFKVLNEDEKILVNNAAEMISKGIKIPCTGCSYCTDGCPMNIEIPKYFDCYNKEDKAAYEEAAATFGKASDCIGCGQCEAVCPQHLSIIDLLKDVAETFEN